MQLSYRGIQYNQQSVSLKAEVTKTKGHYRGGDYQICRISGTRAKSNNLPRTYRGVNY